jgi:hypothetical protein
MSEIGRLGGGGVQQTQGEPAQHGQPTGLTAPAAPGQQKLMTDALTGRDPSQAVAAEQIRAAGGALATEDLLSLNRQPSIVGAFARPPGNSEALRHITPEMRRAILRTLLQRQHERLGRLTYLLCGEGSGRRGRGGEESSEGREEPLPALDPGQDARARGELGRAVLMLELLEELLAMQDYTFSQMGAYGQ